MTLIYTSRPHAYGWPLRRLERGTAFDGSSDYPTQSLSAWTVSDEATSTAQWVHTRVWLMLAVFLVSLFASCFPALSRRIPGIRIPGVVFFVGKHFGTGIILATAFVHLLQDAFQALMSPEVQERYGVSKWVGMIVLSSLLLIFLVEYIATSYVDRLQSYASAPPSPCSTPSLSPASSPTISPAQLPEPSIGTPNDRQGRKEDEEDEEGGASHLAGVPLALASPESEREVDEDDDREAEVDEVTPLVVSSRNHALPAQYGTNASGRPRPVGYAHTFPRSTHPPHPPAMTTEPSRPGDEIFMGGHHRHEQRGSHAEHHACAKGGWRGWFGLGGDDSGSGSSSSDCRVANGNGKGREGRTSSDASAMREHERRHAHGHGTKHVHAHGHLHMDMESWGGDRGIHEQQDGGAEAESGNGDKDAAQGRIGRRRQVVGILMLEVGIMLHSLVIGLTLAITSGPEFTSLVTAIMFHQLFEGLSLGIRIATLPAEDEKQHERARWRERVLKPALALMFAVTTPVGIAIGLAVFGPGESEGVKVILLTGVMSALSAGMLIYAACVEMLAGDFVLDPHLWRSSVGRQALALCALLAGVAAMGAVGIVGE